MINHERLIAEFLELVQVASESGAERQIADLLKQKLTELGLAVTEDQAGAKLATGTGNVIGKLPAAGAGGLLLLSAHMDTVKPGWEVKPIRQGGRITSDGTTILGSDDKAGIAAILETVRVIQEGHITHGGLEIVFTVGEETGLLGAKHLDYGRIQAKCGFVLDSSGSPGEIIIKAPRQDTLKFTVKGKAAHAGMAPETGINAIQVAANGIMHMKIGRIDSETTANIGLINGGKAINIVPDQVVVEGEARSLQAAKLAGQVEHMCAAMRQAADKFQTTVDIQVAKEYDSINLTDHSRPVQIALAAAQSMGLKPRLEQTGGASDANVFNGRGIACANLGIGMQKVHTTEEFINEADLIGTAELLVEIVKVVGQRKDS